MKPRSPSPPPPTPRSSSLGGRLFAFSTFVTVLTLAVTLLVMHAVLQRFVTAQIDQRLDDKIATLASQLHAGPGDIVTMSSEPIGPPFDKSRHDAFWLVAGPHNVLMTSWLRPGDIAIPTPGEIATMPLPPIAPGELPDAKPENRPRTMKGRGPRGDSVHLRVVRRLVDDIPVTIAVAAPVAAIAGPVREGMATVGVAMACLGLALFGAAIVQVRLGLRPLGHLRRHIADVRSGGADQLPVHQPREILPLVVELNLLLRQNAENLVRARRHVANLAHGLKTPLATLSLAAQRIEGEDQAPLRDLVGMIERRIRHHLGRARNAALDGASRGRTPLDARLRDLADVLNRIHADKAISITIESSDHADVACDPQDVDEILGNLLDNAFKYTRTRVACRAVDMERTVVVTIADDGPGLDDREIEHVMNPGQRLDESVPGFGFGLPIARELAELYGGALTLSRGPEGLVVTLVLPRAGYGPNSTL